MRRSPRQSLAKLQSITPTRACKVRAASLETVQRLTSMLLTVFGGIGFNTEMPMEKLYRDAKIFELCEWNIMSPGEALLIWSKTRELLRFSA